MTQKRWREIGLSALLTAAAAAASIFITQPPSPLAAAQRFLDSLLFILAAPEAPPSDDIVIVAITDETIAAFPYRSPIDRQFLAELVATIDAASPRAIGLDLLLDQPTEPQKDERLREALLAAGPRLVGITVGAETRLEPQGRKNIVRFLFGLRRGTANLARDRFDGLIRLHVPARAKTGERSFAAALAEAAGVAPPFSPFTIRWRKAPAGAAPFGIYPAHTLRFVPRQWLAGKIVLVGTMITGADEHRTPSSVFSAPMHGVEIHAHILQQILDGGAAPSPAEWVDPGLAFAGAGIGVVVASLGPIVAVLTAALVLAGLWASSLVAAHFGVLVSAPLAASLALLLGAGATRFRRARAERRDRRNLMKLFDRFVGAPVASKIWEARDTFLAGGRPKPQELVATVMFCDIAGFTPVCERLAPDDLISWLDRYIDAVVRTMVQHDGVALRFIGDGVLAAFGAPVARTAEGEIDEDARAAASCALALADAMRQLNSLWRASGAPEAALRIGLNTGPLIAGSIGAGSHMEYCLLGDTVNTAARLEAHGKTLWTGAADDCVILLGEETARRLGAAFSAQRIGQVSLRGKSYGIEVYRLTRQAEVPPLEAAPEKAHEAEAPQRVARLQTH